MNVVGNSKNNIALILFLIISLFIMLFIKQNQIIEPGSMVYWLIIAPALVLPINKFQYITYNIFFKTWPILLMVIITFIWSFYKHDIPAVFRLVLFLIVLSWLEINGLIIKVKTLSSIYILSILISIFIYLFTNINHWGLLPGTTDIDFGIWRISFFPNIANTAFFSLFIFMLCTKDKGTYSNNKFVVYVSIYFMIFSFVRTVIISLIVYIVLHFLLKKINNKKWLFIFSLISAFLVNCIVAYSSEIIYYLQSNPIINRFFLRGQHSLSHHDILVQMYRPWLWKQQMTIFLDSQYLMGQGAYNFSDFSNASINGGETVEANDSVSLLLGMLASFGLPVLLFYYYLINKLYINAVKLDAWACSIFPIIIFICMQWGSIFHPANAMFVIYFLILLRGKKAFC